MTTHLEQGLYSYLSTQVTLTALVGTRIYPMFIPQGATIPCITYQRISTPRTPTHDTSGRGDLVNPRVQFDIWSETQKSGSDIGAVLTALLNGKVGAIGSGGNQITIRASLQETEVPDYDPEIKLFRNRVEFIIWYQEV